MRTALREYFGVSEAWLGDEVAAQLVYTALRPGDVVLRQDDPADAVFFVISGRLRAIRSSNGVDAVVGEIIRGEMFGELGLITGDRRAATVVATRDSLVARMTGALFEAMLAAQPHAAMVVMRTVIERFRRADHSPRARKPQTTLCLLPITGGVAELVPALLAALGAWGEGVRLLTAQDAGAEADHAGLLGAAEGGAALLLLLADPGPTRWSRACIAHADQVLLLADAASPPGVSEAEAVLLDREDAVTQPAQTLVLLHDPAQRSPTGTAAWLRRREVGRHIHVRRGHGRDLRRLARLVTGRGIGLALAGGGARGFAHVGVIQALEAAGIEPDVIAGTSIGSAVGGVLAMDVRGDALRRAVRRIFVEQGNPTGDYNLLPLLSLVRGRRVRTLTQRAVQELVGRDIGIEDTWTTFVCVAVNFSTATEAALTTGPLAKSLLASFALPGALPPIILDGHFHVDGGTMNNLPVDVLERYGLGKVIAVDLMVDRIRRVALDWMPGTAAWLRDRFRAPDKRRYDVPGLGEMLLTASLLPATGRQREMRGRADLCFRPPLQGVGLLDWSRFDSVVQLGRHDAEQVLAAMGEEALKAYR